MYTHLYGILMVQLEPKSKNSVIVTGTHQEGSKGYQTNAHGVQVDEVSQKQLGAAKKRDLMMSQLMEI
ncbi:hypothetical protein Dsin_016290 [Dipteronia sinensis]|uniref:Uncharacterized protein n=1 Tax=Dipteronia sinensis TaxID=43782 RepID=A0AAE0ACY0_9ROSI|nr:hypothetical protein Dsin_016290 [Dipteronia sinensis]